MVGQGSDQPGSQPGTLVSDRYLVLNDNILLDRYPAHPPEMPREISILLEAYLKLSYFIPHLPKVYSAVTLEGEERILLEESAIYPYVIPVISDPENQQESQSGTLMPTLQSEWAIATPFRLLNWVYQITTLWEALNRFNATETLFCMDCIRVDGGLVKLLELRFNPKKKENHTLPFLLQYLIHYNDQSEDKADLTVMRRLRDMYEKLIHEAEEDHSYLLCEWLDQEMIHHSSGSLEVTIVTQTDQGPNRSRNEDSCYPNPKQHVAQRQTHSTDPEKPLLVVCDGIGGHEGGNIASNLAIETFTKVLNDRIPKVSGYQGQIDTANVIEEGIRVSNDAISDRNDQEGRSDRQRMGTTMVLTRAEGQRIQIAHVGDSRAYRITAKGCYQLTVDDDIASREVRLGYTLYREALQHNGSGALTQALGMVSSSLLHPTVRTYFVDEDCIYLLCSDGLSDFDRIEEFWAQELIPVLQGRVKLADACQNLIELANAHNGHDNVTVGLFHCKVKAEISNPAARSTLLPLWSNKSKQAGVQNLQSSDSTQLPQGRRNGKTPVKTQLLQKRQSHRLNTSQGKWIFLFSLLVGIAIVTGVLALLFSPNRLLKGDDSGGDPLVGSKTNPSPGNSLFPEGLKVNQLVKVLPPIAPAPINPAQSPAPTPEAPASVSLLPNPGLPLKGDLDLRVGEIKRGSVLRVVDRQTVSIGSNTSGSNTSGSTSVPWVKLQVCSTEAIGETKQLKPGVEGWHSEETLLSQITPTAAPLSPPASNACPTINSTPTPSPTPSPAIKPGG
jgi:protein phosphatase